MLQGGERCRCGGVTVVRSTGTSDRPRVGFVVTKRTGNAVTRNRIKRRLRHALPVERLQPGNDYVIIASRDVATEAFSALEAALREAVDGCHA